MNTIKQYKIENMSFIEITNDSDFKVTLTDFGASIYTIYFHNDLMNVQVENPKDFQYHYVRYGKTIGRVSGRIAKASYIAQGHTYKVTANEGMNCLHGGDCLAQAIFEIKSIDNNENRTKIVFHYLSKDGEEGFGGNFDINVIYRISNKVPTVHIEYECICDKDCPVNITNHTYYSLGESSIGNLTLYINSNRYVKPSILDMIPVGLSSVPKYMDFTKPKLITTHIDEPLINKGRLNGYDHFFLFNEQDADVEQIKLTSKKYSLTLFTDYAGAQIYTNNNAKPIKCLNTPLERRRGVAIEPQALALNQNLIIPAQHKMHHTITLRFAKK